MSEQVIGRELFLEANNGKIQMWKAEVLPELTKDGFVEIVATYGMTDGKKQTKSTFVKSGKNIGKKNETTIFEQANLKTEQMYADKIKNKAMVFSMDDWVRPMRPSLAISYDKRKKFLSNVKYWLADEKLDGNRAYTFVDGSIQSKSGDVITPFPYIDKELEILKQSLAEEDLCDIDGEFYLHGLPLQDITGIVNTEDHESRRTDIELEYHIFGCFVPSKPNMSAKDRYKHLLRIFKGHNFKYLVLREKIELENDEEIIREYVKKCELAGYEGAILLNPDEPYHHSKNPSDRNDAMIKVKNMKDEEFLILDIIENENEVGIPKFIVSLPNDLSNEVVMKGKKEDTKKYLIDREKYIGQYLKVQYQAWTKYGKLEFPVGLEIRIGTMTEHGFDAKH